MFHFCMIGAIYQLVINTHSHGKIISCPRTENVFRVKKCHNQLDALHRMISVMFCFYSWKPSKEGKQHSLNVAHPKLKS